MKQSKIDVQVQTNITGGRPMGVDPEAMGHILSILSKMYADPNLAIVREYASNALDSHRVAGNNDPILVTSPSHFDPTLRVQDFGTGLSKREVDEVYAVYGTSTKRGADNQIGHFGIGAKSAFAAGEQFIVTAVKDGRKTITLFKIDDNGAPTVNILFEDDTDEPNGVLVEVGVRDVTATQNAIQRLFPYWPQGTVMVDGVEPNSVWSSVEKLADDVHIGWREPHTYGEWTAVMGGIPYTVTTAVIDSLTPRQMMIARNILNSQAHVYLTVGLGDVDITPSREELMVTPQTSAAIGKMVEKFHELLGPWASKKIEDAASMIDAVTRYDEIATKVGPVLGGRRNVFWNGKPVPENPIDTEFTFFKLGYKRGYNSGRTAKRYTQYRLVPNAGLRHVLFVTGVPERRVRSVQLAAREYLLQQDQGSQDKISYVVAITCDYAEGWFDIKDAALRKMTFDDFLKFKPAPSPRGGGSGSNVRYPLAWRWGGVYGPAEVSDLRKATTIYYLTHNEYLRTNTNSDLVKTVVGTSPLVLLKSTQKTEMLIKRLPQSVSLTARLNAYAGRVLAGVTQDDIDALGAHVMRNLSNREITRFLRSERANITNGDVLAFLDQLDKADALVADAQVGARIKEIRDAARILGKDSNNLGKPSWDTEAWDNLAKGLPLMVTYFERTYYRDPEGNRHVILYINMVGDQSI